MAGKIKSVVFLEEKPETSSEAKDQPSAAIVCSPYILAIWIGYILENVGIERIKICFLRLLRIFEYLEIFSMRYLTGYFVAVKAIKGQNKNMKRRSIL